MTEWCCQRIAEVLRRLKEIGANTEQFEYELNDLELRISKFKANYERNEINC